MTEPVEMQAAIERVEDTQGLLWQFRCAAPTGDVVADDLESDRLRDQADAALDAALALARAEGAANEADQNHSCAYWRYLDGQTCLSPDDHVREWFKNKPFARCSVCERRLQTRATLKAQKAVKGVDDGL